MKKIILVASIFVFQTGCNINRLVDELITTREEAIYAVDDAIYSVDNGIADVKTTLADLDGKLSKNLQDVLVFNVPYITNTLIGESIVGGFCSVDFTAQRAVFYLNLLKSELLTGEAPIDLRSVICQSSIDKLDLNAPIGTRNLINIYGYDFSLNHDSITAFFVNNHGQEFSIPEINFQSNYEFTVDISGYSDNTIKDYKYFAIKFGADEIFSISIIQKSQPIPQVLTVYVAPPSLSYFPPHVPGQGNLDYSSNGPEVTVEGRFYFDNKQAYVKLWMNAIETKPDWTQAKGWSPNHYFYTAPSGWHIKRIEGVTVFPNLVRYIDIDHQEDIFSTALGQATIKGDGSGNDAGIQTGITNFNFSYKVPIVIEQD